MMGTLRAVVSLLVLVALGVSCGDDSSTGPLVPARIIIIPNQPVIGQGLTLQLTATVVDATGHAMNGQLSSFSSDSPAIVDVSTTGLLTSLGPLGDALITADDHGLTRNVRVRVSQRVGAIAVPNPLRLHRHTSLQLSHLATDVAGNVIPNGSFSFTSSDSSIATVNQAGLITAPGATGDATISVAIDTFKVKVPVTVYVRPTTLHVTPPQTLVPPGGTRQLSAEVLDSVGDPIVGSAITYTGHNSAIFTVSASGLITATASTGTSTVGVRSGALSKGVRVWVGNGIAGRITGTAKLSGAGYGVAIGPGGEVFAGVFDGSTVFHGTLPSHTLEPLVVGNNPMGLAINPAGTRAYVALGPYVALPYVPQVAVVDIAGNTVLAPITGFGAGFERTPYTMAVSPDNQILYVGTTDWVYFIDATTRAFLDSIPAQTALHMALHPSQPLLYVSMYDVDQVVEINTTSRQVTRTFEAGPVLQAVGVSPAGDRLYAVNEGGLLLVWDLASGQETNTVFLAGSGSGIGVTDKVVIVAEPNGNIEVFDRVTLQRRTLLKPGGRPRRVAINGAGTVAVVTNDNGWVNFVE